VTGRAALALVTALSIAGAIPARADGAAATTRPAVPNDRRKIVGVLEVRVDGVSTTAAEKFETGIEDGLSSTEYWVATRKRMREILAGSSWSEGCVVGPCLAEVKRQTNADLIVDAYFEGTGSSYRFVVTLIETGAGSVVAQVADHCDVCTLTEALDTAALDTIGLVNGANDTPIKAPPHTPATIDHPGRRGSRRASLLLFAGAALAGGTAAYFFHADKRDLGYAGAGAAVGLGVGGFAALALSFRF
jgi:hypothetical protein